MRHGQKSTNLEMNSIWGKRRVNQTRISKGS